MALVSGKSLNFGTKSLAEKSCMRDIAWVTCEERKDLTTDEQLVVKQLRAIGLDVMPTVWDDTRVDWKDYRLIIVRSVWDYHLKINQFLDWLNKLQMAGLNVSNPVEILKWNHHKFYLQDLEVKGVPIIPSVYIKKGGTSAFYKLINKKDWEEIVLKPAVSATALGLIKVIKSGISDHQEEIEKLIRNNDTIAQHFQPTITKVGEWSFMFFNKRFSHAVLKHPKQGDFRVQSDFGGSIQIVQPGDDLLKQVEIIIDAISEDLLYCRVDGIVLEGQFTLMEIELIEPELFLLTEKIRQNFASAIQFLCN